MMDDLSFLKGLPFVDAFFPNGGYAHSFGLEVAVHEGRIRKGQDLEPYLYQWLKEGVSRSDAIAVSVANHALVSGSFQDLLNADGLLEAMKICREIREASRQMGRQVLKMGSKQSQHPMIHTLDRLVEEGETPGHHAVAMGIVLGGCGWSARMAVIACLYQTVVGWVSAALRLLPIGQAEGQRILHSLLPLVVSVSREIEGLGLEDLTSWMPLHEIRSMRHAQMEVRLFRS